MDRNLPSGDKNGLNTDAPKSVDRLLDDNEDKIEVARTKAVDQATLEREAKIEALRHNWRHDRLIVTGPALYASLIGRGQDEVETVDLVLTTREQLSRLDSGAESVEELQYILDNEEFEALKGWVDDQGYSGKPIRVIRDTEVSVPYNEAIKSERKLQIWHRPDLPPVENDIILRSHVLNNLPLLERDLERPVDISERIEPNGTLARALEVLRMGEMLGLAYDDTSLRNAEQLARRGSMVLLTFEKRDDYGYLGPGFIEQLQSSDVARVVGAKYQRLSQVAEAIAAAGGVNEYIESEFGAAYLDEDMSRYGVKLYDVKLAESPATIEEQLKFLRLWRELTVGFDVEGQPERLFGRPDLLAPEGLYTLIDENEVEKALNTRAEHQIVLDGITGVYEINVSSNERQAREKAEAYLKVMGYPSLEQTQRDGEGLARTLIRQGVSPQNPILSQLSFKGSHKVELIVSAKPEDILQASYKKPWTSCVDLDGGTHSQGLYEDIANGAVVAYLVDGDTILARIIIRSGTALDSQFELTAAIETFYGDERYEDLMRGSLETILSNAGIRSGVPMQTLPYTEATAFDSDTGVTFDGKHFYYTDSVGSP